MAVVIRLKRTGRKKNPFYRMVVADGRNPVGGMFVDDLGHYDPMQDPAQIEINEEKALMWLKDGATPTDTVKSILSKAGVLAKFHAQKNSLDLKEDETQTEDQPDSEQEEP